MINEIETGVQCIQTHTLKFGIPQIFLEHIYLKLDSLRSISTVVYLTVCTCKDLGTDGNQHISGNFWMSQLEKREWVEKKREKEKAAGISWLNGQDDAIKLCCSFDVILNRRSSYETIRVRMKKSTKSLPCLTTTEYLILQAVELKGQFDCSGGSGSSINQG